APPAAAMDLAELRFLRHQHQESAPSLCSGGGVSGGASLAGVSSTGGCSFTGGVSSVRGFSTFSLRLRGRPPDGRVPPSAGREAPRPSLAPPRRRRASWSPSRTSPPLVTLSKPSGMISPLLIHTLTPIRPEAVRASTKP